MNSGMAAIASSPPEVLCQVFQRCQSFKAALALARTCKILFAIWKAENKIILWNIGLNSVLSFEDALIAVWATELIKVAYTSGRLPPEIDIRSLNGTSLKPKLSEIRSVLDLEYFVRYLQYRVMNPRESPSPESFGRRCSPMMSHDQFNIWRTNFHRSAYKMFIAGAVLSRAYQQPFFESQRRPADNGAMFFQRASYLLREQGWHPAYVIKDLPMNHDELQCLNSSPIYNFVSHPGWDKCFSNFADWLIMEAQDRLQLATTNIAKSDVVRGNAAQLKEVMQLIAMYGLMEDRHGSIIDRRDPYWSRNRNSDGYDCDCHSAAAWARQAAARSKEYPLTYYVSDSDDLMDEEELRTVRETENPKTTGDNDEGDAPKLTTRTTTTVRFGTFVPRLHKIRSGPSFPKYSSDIWKIVHLDEDANDANPPDIPDIQDLSHILHCLSGRPNHVIDDDDYLPLPHPPLHLFSFLLQKYFGYRFDNRAFEVRGKVSIYETFVQDWSVFTNDGCWDGMLSSTVEKQRMTYRKIKWGQCVG